MLFSDWLMHLRQLLKCPTLIPLYIYMYTEHAGVIYPVTIPPLSFKKETVLLNHKHCHYF